MAKFKKKQDAGLPAISTSSLPDIVFMLLFFFMVSTVLNDGSLLVENTLPKADQVEKLMKDRSIYIYAGKPSSRYVQTFGTASKIQIGDKYTEVNNLQFALSELRQKLRPELQDKVMVALKVDQDTKTGIVSDIKQELRHLNMLRLIYITTPGNELTSN